MAKKAETQETPEPRAGNNGFGGGPEKVQAIFARLDSLAGDLLSERSEYMLKCKDIRGDIREVIKEGEALGMDKVVLRGVVKNRELRAKAAEAIAFDDIDRLHQAQAMLHALGDLADTPLGQAAMAPNGAGLPAEL